MLILVTVLWPSAYFQTWPEPSTLKWRRATMRALCRACPGKEAGLSECDGSLESSSPISGTEA